MSKENNDAWGRTIKAGQHLDFSQKVENVHATAPSDNIEFNKFSMVPIPLHPQHSRPFKASLFVSFVDNEPSIITEPGEIEVACFESKNSSWSVRWGKSNQLELYGITSDGVAILQQIWSCEASDQKEVKSKASKYLNEFIENRMGTIEHNDNFGSDEEHLSFEKYPFQVRLDEFTYNYLSDRGTEKFLTCWNGKEDFQVFEVLSDDADEDDLQNWFRSSDYMNLLFDSAQEEEDADYDTVIQTACEYAQPSSYLHKLDQLTEIHWFLESEINDRCSGNPRDAISHHSGVINGCLGLFALTIIIVVLTAIFNIFF